jgi:hypothetical protein
MAILVFVFSLLLLAAGLASGYMSLDLLPTSLGVLYALSGAVAVAFAIVAFALGVLIRRIDALAKLVRQPVALLAAEPGAAALAPLEAGPLPAQVSEEPASAETESVARAAALVEDAEDPINENRAGHLPTFHTTEHAIETPERPPTLIGRYSAGGANYMIFEDGSIEAETADGAFKFASMGDFKRYLADRKAEKANAPDAGSAALAPGPEPH